LGVIAEGDYIATIEVWQVTPGPEQLLQAGPAGAYCVSEGCRLHVSTPAAANASATLSGAPLPRQDWRAGDAGLKEGWFVEIFVWAGQTSLVLDFADARDERTIMLDVAPHAGKLGADRFRAMLDELSREGKDLLWGLSPGGLPAVRDSGSPGVIHPAIVEAELPGLLHALRRLQRDPLHWQERRREIAPLGRSRRPDYRTLRWMASHGQTLVALESIAASDGQIDPRLAVDQPITLTTLDHPATRYVAFLLVRLRLSLEATAGAFDKVAGAAGEGRSIEPEMQKRAARLGRLLQAAGSEISSIMRTGIFRSVTPAPMSESALQAIGGHPLYARVHQLARKLLDPGLRLGKPMTPAELTGSLRTSFDLYELFVLHRLRRAVRDLAGPDWEFQDGELASGIISATSVTVSTRWSATSPDGRTRLALDFQPTFRAHDGGTDADRKSLSGERREGGVK
jgi:hypothetical protein